MWRPAVRSGGERRSAARSGPQLPPSHPCGPRNWLAAVPAALVCRARVAPCTARSARLQHRHVNTPRPPARAAQPRVVRTSACRGAPAAGSRGRRSLVKSKPPVIGPVCSLTATYCEWRGVRCTRAASRGLTTRPAAAAASRCSSRAPEATSSATISLETSTMRTGRCPTVSRRPGRRIGGAHMHRNPMRRSLPHPTPHPRPRRPAAMDHVQRQVQLQPHANPARVARLAELHQRLPAHHGGCRRGPQWPAPRMLLPRHRHAAQPTTRGAPGCALHPEHPDPSSCGPLDGRTAGQA